VQHSGVEIFKKDFLRRSLTVKNKIQRHETK
jgi:hypothetical protein